MYLLLEYCNGGELFTVLHTRDRDGVPSASAKFYCGYVHTLIKLNLIPSVTRTGSLGCRTNT